MNKAFVLSFVIAIALSATVIMAAGANQQISLQGKLTDASGKPLDGPYSVTFKIYDAATGGTQVGGWSETQAVTVSKGLFQTQLGSVVAFPAGVAFDKPYWVEIMVGTETLSPRYVLAGSPYTVRAPVMPTIPTQFQASQIVQGVFDIARIPMIPATKISGIDGAQIISGTLAVARIPTLTADKIPSLDAAKVTTGILAVARIPTLTADKIPSLDAGKITTGVLTAARIPALDASAITTGTLSADRIAPFAIGQGKVSFYTSTRMSCQGSMTGSYSPTTQTVLCSAGGSGYTPYCTLTSSSVTFGCTNFDGTKNTDGTITILIIDQKSQTHG